MKQNKETSEAARKMAKAKHAKLSPQERSEHGRKMKLAALARATQKEKALTEALLMWEKMTPQERKKHFSAGFIREFGTLLEIGWEPKEYG